MKKSLLALAVLGAFAGAASAQSSVTIYGSLDLGIAKSNGGTAGSALSGTGTSKAWQVQQSNGSRLGFQGNEDLGGGLSAQFQIEHRFNPDTGTQSNAGSFWQGRSYVQLTSATAGAVYLGREYTPTFWPALKSDPFGWDGVGQGGIAMWAGFTAPSPVISPAAVTPTNLNGAQSLNARTSNTVGYKSPSLGGLTAQLAVAMGEGSVGRDTGLNLQYGAGPLYAAFGYEKVNGVGTNSAKDTNSHDGDSLWNLALHYDFGVVKPMFYYARAKNATTNATNKFWQLGALAPVGGGTIKAAYWRLDIATANLVINGQDQRKFGLGYDYPLSKRTNVYADLGLTRKDLATNNTTYQFGVKHTF